ncbi:hypothetical protein, partial [Jatrophihabitans sp.]|uniref:hypothetical protein n=1 Tax=Jatrophihabitans sp. TaxID=1932789 RepID=UPI0030C6D81E|nr:hypothetical protein [Jatrophihabitans sp.]
MTSYPPPPMPAAQPGPPPAAPGKTRLRGRRLLQLGVILFIAAVVLFVIGGIGSSKSSDKEKSFQRITPTRLATDSGVAVRVGTGSVTFPKVGGYIAYYEGSDITDKIIPKAAVQITSPSGKPDLLDTLYGALNGNKVKPLEYTYKGTKGAALYEFHISEPGTYSVIVEIKGSAPSGADVAFGKSIGTTEAVGAGFIVGGLLLLLAAIVLFIVGLVKRRRHKKELANPVGYPAFPAGGYP